MDLDKWEEVPAEDLWQDGMLTYKSVMLNLYGHVCVNGDWKILRRKYNNQDLTDKKIDSMDEKDHLEEFHEK